MDIRSKQSEILSNVAKSCQFTMGIVSKIDPRRNCPETGSYVMPDLDTRLFRAKLIMEEAIETCTALGVQVTVNTILARAEVAPDMHNVTFTPLRCQTCGGSGVTPFPGGEDADGGDVCHVCNGWKHQPPDLIGIIDGCCDTIYVTVGTLCAMGVPDLPHLDEVNRANNDKFPGGVAFLNEDGKFLKPEGWTPPDHQHVISKHAKKGKP
jgi:hypothetical protein